MLQGQAAFVAKVHRNTIAGYRLRLAPSRATGRFAFWLFAAVRRLTVLPFTRGRFADARSGTVRAFAAGRFADARSGIVRAFTPWRFA